GCTYRILVLMVSCPAMYCSVKRVRILPGLGQKRMAKSMKSGIRIDFNLITGHFPEPSHLGFEHPGLEFQVPMTGLAEYVPALGFRDQPFEDLFHFFIDLQDALPCPPLQPA